MQIGTSVAIGGGRFSDKFPASVARGAPSIFQLRSAAMVTRLTQWGFAAVLLATAVIVQAQDEAPAPKPKPGAPVPEQPEGPTIRAREILGSEVTLKENAAGGTVEDLVMDGNGQVEFLVVQVAPKKLVTVPWDAVQFNVEKRVATVHIAPKQYQAIPTYTTTTYPTFFAPAYRTQVYGYYGLTPGQERRAIRRGVLP
jgi:hypothetical protein